MVGGQAECYGRLYQTDGLIVDHLRSLRQGAVNDQIRVPAIARRIVADFVAYYDELRLHSAIGYVTPADEMAGRERAIFAERDRKLDAARQRRRAARAASRAAV